MSTVSALTSWPGLLKRLLHTVADTSDLLLPAVHGIQPTRRTPEEAALLE